MNAMNKGVLIAGVAASLVLAGSVGARAEEEKTGGEVYCSGINSCKGTGACGGAGHTCAGQNGCKGQGLIKTTEADCEAKGGKVVPNPMVK